MSLLWSQTGPDQGCRTGWNVTAILGSAYTDLEGSHEQCGIWSGLILRLLKNLMSVGLSNEPEPKAASSGHDLDQVSETSEAVTPDG